MKTIIILGALAFSTGAFAQVPVEKIDKQVRTTQTEVKQGAEKVQQDVKQQVSQKKEEISKIDRTDIDLTNVNETLSNAEEEAKNAQAKIEKKMAEGKAAEAKLKATQVKTEADADAMIRTSKEETKETMSSINTKMVTARTKLSEKLASGEITQVQFNEKMKQLLDFENRKNAIISEMK